MGFDATTIVRPVIGKIYRVENGQFRKVSSYILHVKMDI